MNLLAWIVILILAFGQGFTFHKMMVLEDAIVKVYQLSLMTKQEQTLWLAKARAAYQQSKTGGTRQVGTANRYVAPLVSTAR